jgi:hypothetical protein
MRNRFAIATLARGFLISSLLMSALMISPLSAQIRSAGSGTFNVAPSPTAGVRPGFVGSGVTAGPARFHRGHNSGRGSILFPYPYYYSDFGYEPQEAAPPQVVVMPAPAPAVQTPPASPPEPLLIEWQGDHFERMTLSEKTAASGQTSPDYSEKRRRSSAAVSSATGLSKTRSSNPRSSNPRSSAAALPPHPMPPAILVFRDGRTEEISSYTIMSGTIYSKTDYWASGSWTKKIQVADLDVPATLKLNHEHGLNFVLPANPNEVVMRP